MLKTSVLVNQVEHSTNEQTTRKNTASIIHTSIFRVNHCRDQNTFEITHEHLLVTISKSTKLLLTSGVPAVKPYLSIVRKEVQWMNFNSDCRYTQSNKDNY